MAIDEVVAEYDRYNFDANQDAPGNLHWQELLAVSPKGTKVILTGKFQNKVYKRFNVQGFCYEKWYQNCSI